MRLIIENIYTPTGPMQLATDDAGRLRALEWVDLKARRSRLLKRQYAGAQLQLDERAPFSDAHARLTDYFAGDLKAVDGIVVAFGGTVFQQEVWTALRQITLGKTISYGELASRINRPKAVRAVGLANGANAIGIVVPCHRVIGQNGKLTGYGGGLERKKWLLVHEGAISAELV